MLEIMFPASYSQATWIVFMGLMLVPVCLVPTLKEGAFAAAAGSIGTIVADAIALYLLVDNMTPIPADLSTPPPNLSFKQVSTVFGNLAFAYGAGIVIPALQREHSQPERMPRVIFFTMGLITVLFLVVAIAGVSTVGCQIPGNLLFAIAGTKLGWTANRGGVILAMMFMQLHVTIAFAVIIFPAFYTLERMLLGIHKDVPQEAAHQLEAADYAPHGTPIDGKVAEKANAPLNSSHDDDSHDTDIMQYRAPGVYPKVAILRIIVVTVVTIISVVWKDHLLDLLDFIGASSMAGCCMILPIVLYLKHFGNRLSLPERAWAWFAVIVSTVIGVYVTYNAAGPLFNPAPSDPSILFPFCSGSYKKMVYTNVTYHQNYTPAPTFL